jgi:hypothetical protein
LALREPPSLPRELLPERLPELLRALLLLPLSRDCETRSRDPEERSRTSLARCSRGSLVRCSRGSLVRARGVAVRVRVSVPVAIGRDVVRSICAVADSLRARLRSFE